jgi:glycosyltransferase involved in cell wall biosynthesis
VPGVLFQPDDEGALVDALDAALTTGERPGVADACRAAARRWDWSAVLPRYEALYAEAAAAGGRRRGRPL